MKRLVSLVLAVLLLLTFSGCVRNSDNYKAPANFYYQNTSVKFFEADSVIAHEIRETVNYDGDIVAILNTYLKGPVSDKLLSPFPAGLQVVTTQRINDYIVITLSKEFSSLSGLDLTIACSCICATIMELTGCEIIEFKSEEPLPDNLTTLVFTYDDLYFIDEVL